MSRVTNVDQCCQLAYEFYQREQQYKEQKKQFEDAKSDFEDTMAQYLESIGKKQVSIPLESVADDMDDASGVLSVKMVEKTSIQWFPEKLEKRVTKPVARQVIKKKYSITDMKGLIQYLKSCNVDPQVFKRYLSVEKSVDTNAIDRLGSVGKLTPKNISGCYIVSCSKPYFKLTVKKEEGDDGEWEV